jgi:hypothetical protein
MLTISNDKNSRAVIPILSIGVFSHGACTDTSTTGYCVQFSTETSQSGEATLSILPTGAQHRAGPGPQNKIIFALKLRERPSSREVAPMANGKINTVFSFSTINFLSAPPLPATTAV